MTTREQTAHRFGMAWVGLSLCLGAHVVDEALSGFLEVYNPAVRAIHAHLPFLLLPTFTFKVWLSLLIAAVCVLVALSAFAFWGARWMVPLSYLFAGVMLMNGLWHSAASIYLRRPMPGVYSSPFLLAGSVCLLVTARRFRASW